VIESEGRRAWTLRSDLMQRNNGRQISLHSGSLDGSYCTSKLRCTKTRALPSRMNSGHRGLKSGEGCDRNSGTRIAERL